jgi:hypothetical protein
VAEERKFSSKELDAEARRIAEERFAALKSSNAIARSDDSKNEIIAEYQKFFYRFLSRRSNVRP